MKAFEEYSKKIRCNEIECGDTNINCKGLSCKDCQRIRKEAWRAALEWYQTIAEECEKDCSTDSDFRILYFHLKQVLENEIGG